MLDIFNDDAFGVISLTDAVNLLPEVPTRLGSLGLFTDVPVATTSVVIEERTGQLQLVPNVARGTMPTANKRGNRNARNFLIPHLPLFDDVLAEDVQNVRSFGSDDQLESVSEVVTQRMQEMRNALDLTQEFHRAGALQGVILDADASSVIYNLFTEFGLTQTTIDVDWGTDDIKLKSLAIKRSMSDALGGTAYTGIRVLCSDGWFDNLITDTDVVAAYERFQEGAFLRSDPRAGFEYAGIIWENYDAEVDDNNFITTDQAIAIPMGVPGLFRRYLAPADWMETVNTLGRPFYAKQEPKRFNMGRDLTVQSNPLHMCVRPQCLIELTQS